MLDSIKEERCNHCGKVLYKRWHWMLPWQAYKIVACRHCGWVTAGNDHEGKNRPVDFRKAARP